MIKSKIKELTNYILGALYIVGIIYVLYITKS